MNRKTKLVLNTISSLIKQFIGVICGFILPRLFLTQYGSAVNGLVSSIGQFLSLASLFDAGMGVVIEASLYKPIAEKNNRDVSSVLTSGRKFYTKFVLFLSVYVILISLVYPLIVKDEFNYLYTLTLICAISISSFGQYCFGVTNSVLLSADQRSYINFTAYTVTTLVNTIISVILIKFDCSIQVVKLVSSLVFIVRPIFLALYVKKNYNVNWHEKYIEEPIKQKWNGFTQHIASLVVSNTDIVMVTLFLPMTSVSVYSVYFLVINGVKEIVIAATAGVKSLLGDMIARNERDKISIAFSNIEWTLHTVITFVFTMTAILIVPFVLIYTRGVEDVDYNVPLFGILLCAAYGIYCLRIPYFAVIQVASHFKQTQSSSIVEAIINIFISIVGIYMFGLVGVAYGTLAAMLYRVFYLVWYLSINILNRSIKIFTKNFLVDLLSSSIMFLTTYRIVSIGSDYVSWAIMATKIGTICILELFFLNILFYPKQMLLIKDKILKRSQRS